MQREPRKGRRTVDTAKLLHKLQQADLLERREILGQDLVLLDKLENGLHPLTQGEGIKIDLENVIELAKRLK